MTASIAFWVGIIVAALVMARVEVMGYSTKRALLTGILLGWIAAVAVTSVVGAIL